MELISSHSQSSSSSSAVVVDNESWDSTAVVVEDLIMPTEVSVEDPIVVNAIKISRQFIGLLEDYRFLLSCYQDTCDCQVNFDHQLFLQKMEEKYHLLEKAFTGNPLLADALDDDDEDIVYQLVRQNKRQETPEHEINAIKRVKIVNKLDNNEENSTKGDKSTDFISSDTPELENSETEKEDTAKGEKIAFRCMMTRCEFLCFDHEDMVKHLSNHDGLPETRKIDKNDVLYICDQCSKEFPSSKALSNHMENAHSVVKMFQCDFPSCNYKTKFRCVWDDHRKRHYPHVKEHKCTWEGCDAEFVTRRDMAAHVNFYHKRVKNYSCGWPDCTASFKDSNRLKHHFYTHTGERPYQCTFPGCTSSFKQIPHLQKHLKMHKVDDTTTTTNK